MIQSARRMIVAFAAIVVQILSADAAEGPPVFHVATRTVPPLVQKDNGRLTGFSIDLWNALANRLGGTTEFVEMPDVNSLLDAVHSGKADLGISAISITADRDRSYDPMIPRGGS